MKQSQNNGKLVYLTNRHIIKFKDQDQANHAQLTHSTIHII